MRSRSTSISARIHQCVEKWLNGPRWDIVTAARFTLFLSVIAWLAITALVYTTWEFWASAISLLKGHL